MWKTLDMATLPQSFIEPVLIMLHKCDPILSYTLSCRLRSGMIRGAEFRGYSRT